MKKSEKTPLEYSIGENVLYRQNGICRIDDIRSESFGGEKKDYYVLKSVYDSTVVYIPTDSEQLTSQMRRLLSREEIDKTIMLSGKEDYEWISDNKARASYFDEIISKGSRGDVLSLIKLLSLRKIECESIKKKLFACDERILAAAEKSICEEFAFVLEIERDEVIPYIKKILNV